MPTYEYECQKCHHRFELFQSIKEKPKRSCPNCGGRVKRLLGTGAGIIFKGSGFYSTDYRKPGYTEAAKKESATTTPAPAAKEPAAPKPSTKRASASNNKS
ncbi:MAG TPA: FmdB family zinc ribbon protein [Verrucomicrobiae bacterium]|nr:FmdB family zinc ribbon protein [Verrucomicrobiae bacterium]